MPVANQESGTFLPPRDPKQIWKALEWKLFGAILHDPTSLSLLVSNFVVIGYAVVQNWSLITILWVYLLQSILIGVLTIFKILALKDYSTDGLKINGQPVSPSPQTKRQVIMGFILIYGLFHAGYVVFISAFAGFGFSGSHVNWSEVAMSGFYFLAHHVFSFFHNSVEREGKPNIGNAMFFPFIRILPMQLTIVIGGGVLMLTGANQLVLAFFLILKTAADLLMHLIEHFSSRPGELSAGL